MTGRPPSKLSVETRPRLRSAFAPSEAEGLAHPFDRLRANPEHSRGAGLTLVEVLVALTLVAVVLLPVMIGLSQALVSTSESTITSAATSIARNKVEQIKDLTRRQSFDFNSLAGQPRESADLKPGDHFFELEVTVETVRPDDNQQSGLKRAVVTVYRAGSENPSARVTTHFTPYGI